MSWTLDEAVTYYKSMGAPRDQNALVGLLKEVQQENGGSIPRYMLSILAEGCGVKDSYLLAVIKRIPSLRLEDSHLLEICSGTNCGKNAVLAACGEKLRSERVTVKFVPCMRLCGKGPNIKWDGLLYSQADEALLQKLIPQQEK